MASSALAFAAVAALLTITPGADTAMVLRTVVVAGRRHAVLAAAGVCTGLFGWGLATALGVSALLAASREAYIVLRIIGAAYLVYLGVRALRSSRTDTATDPHAKATAPGTGGRVFCAGLATNLLNPKVGVFYVTFLPQFLPAGAPPMPTAMLYVAIHAAEGIVWLVLVATVIDRARTVFARPAVRQRMEQLTGLVLLGFGVRLALDSR